MIDPATLVEIERKFVTSENFLKYLIRYDKITEFDVEQHYLSFEPEIRLREMKGKYLLTRKRGRGIYRRKRELEIDRLAYEILLPLSKAVIKKTRAEVVLNGRVDLVVDIYDNFFQDMDDVFIIEKEFGSLEAALEFIPPKWFGIEVTDRSEYKNKNMARHGFPKQADL